VDLAGLVFKSAFVAVARDIALSQQALSLYEDLGRRRTVSAKTKQWTGRIKQAAGSLTGNKRLERKGRADRVSGAANERVTRAKNKVGQMIGTAGDALKGRVRTRPR